MARPARSGRGPSTTMLFRITIQRPRGALRRSLRARRRFRARRGRRFGKSVRFRSRRALPPFFLFMEKHRRRVQRSYPNATVVQQAKRLGRMWQRLPEEDKEMYKEMADGLKGRRIRRRLRARSRSRSRPRMSRRRSAMKNLMISFTTKAANLRNFLLSYL